MSAKASRGLHDPTWAEVILAALLSSLLGAVAGAVILVFRPVTPVRKAPPEPVPGEVYYHEGARNGAVSRQAGAKRTAFLGGAPVALSEEELNSLLSPAGPISAKLDQPAKPETAKKAPVPSGAPVASKPVEDGITAVGQEFKIEGSELQIATPLKTTVFGLSKTLLVQARGSFAQQDGRFVFVPATFYLGSCPLHKLPGLTGWVSKKVAAIPAVPPEWADAWGKLADVEIGEGALKLTPQALIK